MKEYKIMGWDYKEWKNISKNELITQKNCKAAH